MPPDERMTQMGQPVYHQLAPAAVTLKTGGESRAVEYCDLYQSKARSMPAILTPVKAEA